MGRTGAFGAFAAAAAEPSKHGSFSSTRQAEVTLTSSKPRPAEKRAAPDLSLEQVRALLEELRRVSSSAKFQKDLQHLRSLDWGAFKKREAVAKLLSIFWKAPLRRFGFGIDGQGFPHLLEVVKANGQRPGIRLVSHEVEKQLRMVPGTLFGLTADVKSWKDEEKNDVKPNGAVANGKATVSDLRGRPMFLGEAKEILKAFKESLLSPAILRTLQNIEQKGGAHMDQHRRVLITQEWNPILKRFDFPANEAGYEAMKGGIRQFAENEYVRSCCHEVEGLCGAPPGSYFGVPTLEEMAAKAEEEKRKAEEARKAEEQKKAEEEARQRIEAEKRQAEEEARKKKEEETKRREEEEARRRKKEEVQRRTEEEAKQKEEEEAKRKQEEETRLHDEENRKREEEAKSQQEEGARLRHEEDVELGAEQRIASTMDVEPVSDALKQEEPKEDRQRLGEQEQTSSTQEDNTEPKQENAESLNQQAPIGAEVAEATSQPEDAVTPDATASQSNPPVALDHSCEHQRQVEEEKRRVNGDAKLEADHEAAAKRSQAEKIPEVKVNGYAKSATNGTLNGHKPAVTRPCADEEASPSASFHRSPHLLPLLRAPDAASDAVGVVQPDAVVKGVVEGPWLRVLPSSCRALGALVENCYLPMEDLHPEPSAPRPAPLGAAGRFVVRAAAPMAVRAHPELRGKVVGVVVAGRMLMGTPHKVAGYLWLRFEESSRKKMGDEEAWALVQDPRGDVLLEPLDPDGRRALSNFQGSQASKIDSSQDTAGTAGPGPGHVPVATPEKLPTPVTDPVKVAQRVETAALARKQLKGPLEFRVLAEDHSAPVRKEPLVQSPQVGKLERGELVYGYPGGGWLQLMNSELENSWVFIGTRLSAVWAELRVTARSWNALEVTWPGLHEEKRVAYNVEWRTPEGAAKQMKGHKVSASNKVVLGNLPSGFLCFRVGARVAAQGNNDEQDVKLWGPWAELEAGED